MNIPKMRQEAARTMKNYRLNISDITDIKGIAGADWVDAVVVAYELGFARGQRAEKRRRQKKGVKVG